MNKQLAPEISQHIDFVSGDVQRLQKLLTETQTIFDNIEREINEIHNPRIKKLLEQMRKENPNWYYSEFDAKERYKRENQSFAELQYEYLKNKRKIDELNEDIRLRKSLIKQLEDSLKRINKYLLIS